MHERDSAPRAEGMRGDRLALGAGGLHRTGSGALACPGGECVFRGVGAAAARQVRARGVITPWDRGVGLPGSRRRAQATAAAVA